jgi:hypothetical protein
MGKREREQRGCAGKERGGGRRVKVYGVIVTGTTVRIREENRGRKKGWEWMGRIAGL